MSTQAIAPPIHRRPRMQMICSRIASLPDVQSLAPNQTREVLFHDSDSGFILYQSSGTAFPDLQERVVRLDMRAALIWINETSSSNEASQKGGMP